MRQATITIDEHAPHSDRPCNVRSIWKLLFTCENDGVSHGIQSLILYVALGFSIVSFPTRPIVADQKNRPDGTSIQVSQRIRLVFTII